MTAEPNLDHPLVEIACRLLTPDPVEKWRFDDEAAEVLERALLSQKSDPTLASAVLGIFQVATDLHHTHGADAAAGRMFALLGAVGPRLFSQMPQEIQDILERVKPSPDRVLPQPFDAQPPEGTIPARDLYPPNPRRGR